MLTTSRIQRIALWLALIQASLSMIGSLVASEIMALPPCDLCWWQRIAWYPLVPLFIIALCTREVRVTVWNAATLTVFGWILSLYQVLLQAGAFSESSILPCSLDNPCTTKVSLFPAPLDVITIPIMSLAGFTIIAVLLVAYARPQTVLRLLPKRWAHHT